MQKRVLKRQPNLDEVLHCIYMMEWCRENDRSGTTNFDLGAIMGELDFYVELYHQLYQEEEMAEPDSSFYRPPNARQVGGSHYRAPYQHWDFAADAGLNYFEGQITKYIARWRKKKGLEDLEKAFHFYEKLLELWAQKRVELSVRSGAGEALNKFLQYHELSSSEHHIFIGILVYRNGNELDALRPWFADLMKEARSQKPDLPNVAGTSPEC